jgi:hypothetical protein
MVTKILILSLLQQDKKKLRGAKKKKDGLSDHDVVLSSFMR